MIAKDLAALLLKHPFAEVMIPDNRAYAAGAYSMDIALVQHESKIYVGRETIHISTSSGVAAILEANPGWTELKPDA